LTKKVVLFEDLKYTNFFPISRMRTVADIRTGRYTQKERAVNIFNCPVVIHSEREGFGNKMKVDEETIFLNARVVNFDTIKDIKKGTAILNKNSEIIAYYSEKLLSRNEIEKLNIIEEDINLYEYIWDIIAKLKEQLEKDLHNSSELGKLLSPINNSIHIENKDSVYIGKDVKIENGVVLDASNGPIYIEDKCFIRAATIIDGPAFIGEKTFIKPGSLLDTVSTGKISKLSGEIEETILQGYSNKQHFGFIGHSYIGEWVNLGAGTTNSDLKNNYSLVRVNLMEEEYQTEMQFLGLMMGDHCKTAINTSINTGTIIEPFCNIFGRNFPPKYLPPFSWWGGYFSEYRLDKAIDTSKKVMKRRNIEMDEKYEDMVRKIFIDTKNLREKLQERREHG
jgi:UDP-N-acetylglucosamine diphosphorylase/glucosamine-1-phosphate N-acetyltransferase